MLLKGRACEAYNIADPRSDLTLKELAGLLAGLAGTRVVYELPDEQERAGYSTATHAVLNAAKLKSLGWDAKFPIETGLAHTVEILKDAAGPHRDNNGKNDDSIHGRRLPENQEIQYGDTQGVYPDMCET